MNKAVNGNATIIAYDDAAEMRYSTSNGTSSVEKNAYHNPVKSQKYINKPTSTPNPMASPRSRRRHLSVSREPRRHRWRGTTMGAPRKDANPTLTPSLRVAAGGGS